jgi:hypothetical protein
MNIAFHVRVREPFIPLGILSSAFSTLAFTIQAPLRCMRVIRVNTPTIQTDDYPVGFYIDVMVDILQVRLSVSQQTDREYF